MKEYVVMFMIVAVIFAIASLIYVVASIIRELRKRKKAKTEALVEHTRFSNSACGWLVLASAVGIAGGVATAFLATRSNRLPKNSACMKKVSKKNLLLFWFD